VFDLDADEEEVDFADDYVFEVVSGVRTSRSGTIMMAARSMESI